MDAKESGSPSQVDASSMHLTRVAEGEGGKQFLKQISAMKCLNVEQFRKFQALIRSGNSRAYEALRMRMNC